MQSWRANADLQIIIYDTNPDNIDPYEIAAVTEQIVGYAAKGNETIQHEKDQMKSLIMS